MRTKKVAIIIVIIVVIIGQLPVKVTCGVPGYTCATAPDEQGYYHTFYEYEPLAVMVIETVTRSSFPVVYWSGSDSYFVGAR
ncbi:MAG: hypothetical protein WCP97_01730 [bacterium]